MNLDKTHELSRKQIMARTGPELDNLIATRIMKWVEVNPRDSAAFWRPDNPFCTVNEYMAPLNWSPSSDMAAMGDVVKQMKDDGYLLELRTYPDPKPDQPGITTGCRFRTYDEIDKEWSSIPQWYPGDDERSGYADTIPLAICRAALVAVNVSRDTAAKLRSA